jgi:hypothetical protein
MGISLFGIALLAQTQKHMGPAEGERVALALGYPDILASPTQLHELLGKDVFDRLTFREDSADILRWHRAEDITDTVVESGSLFTAWQMKLEVGDIVNARGGEFILDLNQPCAPALHARYDLLLDFGTIEHCFNIGQAAKNIAMMTKIGGYIIHGSPLNMLNHGFYNLCPTWFADFYNDNGFDFLYLKAVSGNLRNPRVHEVPPFNRFIGIPEDSTLLCIVKKRQESPIIWPLQTKYKNNPTLKI